MEQLKTKFKQTKSNDEISGFEEDSKLVERLKVQIADPIKADLNDYKIYVSKNMATKKEFEELVHTCEASVVNRKSESSESGEVIQLKLDQLSKKQIEL